MLTITKRLVTTDVRSRILLSSLNGKMSDALLLLRQQQQTSVDVELLHTRLARAAALAHARHHSIHVVSACDATPVASRGSPAMCKWLA